VLNLHQFLIRATLRIEVPFYIYTVSKVRMTQWVPIRHRIQRKEPVSPPMLLESPPIVEQTAEVNEKTNLVIKKKEQISSVPWSVPIILPRNKWIVGSFDIGVKTLSYSILSYDPSLPSGKEYQIYDWDIIDLIPSDTKSLVCDYPLNSGKRKGQACGKKASYSYSDQNAELKGVCKVHSNKIAESTTLIQERMVHTMTNMELNIEVVNALDKRPIFLEVDEILLEHQPSKNPRMKNLSYMLHSYFVLRGLVDANQGDRHCRLINIRFISPKNKLNVYDGPVVPQKYKRPYDENKYRSKVYSEYLIREDPERLEYFKSSHKKRDDLGDAFLQGAWYLKKNNKRLMRMRSRHNRE